MRCEDRHVLTTRVPGLLPGDRSEQRSVEVATRFQVRSNAAANEKTGTQTNTAIAQIRGGIIIHTGDFIILQMIGASIRLIERAQHIESVDLPEPDGPMMAKINSPLAILINTV